MPDMLHSTCPIADATASWDESPGRHPAASPVDRVATRLALRRLGGLGRGRLHLRLPDGERRVLGGVAPGPDAAVNVHAWPFFRRLLGGGDVGAGESYMLGEWSSPDLVQAARLFIANEDALSAGAVGGLARRAVHRLRHLFRANTRAGAKRNIRAHYDLGNDLYALFLDETMTYSCAVFEEPGQPLAAAQRAKYRRLAEKAGLKPGDHVLEIGCGWGGFAELAAGELGCRVTGLTLSEQQARFARARIRRTGLDDRVEIRLEDYRDVEGSFDAVVSIEMLEAVGHRYLPTFVAACDRLLRPHGRVVLQSITIPDQLYDSYRRGVDWIRSHIFPGGHLPSLKALQDALVGSTAFTLHHLENIGVHYAETLRRWRRSFLEQRAEVRALGYDDVFVRMWELYLAVCEAGFAHGKLGDLQLVLVRPGSTALPAGPYAGPGPGASFEGGVT